MQDSWSNGRSAWTSTLRRRRAKGVTASARLVHGVGVKAVRFDACRRFGAAVRSAMTARDPCVIEALVRR